MSKTTTTVEQLSAAMIQRRQAAAREYRELLNRNDYPQAGDAERLAACMQTLGRGTLQLAEDLEVVKGLETAENAQTQNAALDEPIRQAVTRRNEAINRMEAERKELHEKHAKQHDEVMRELSRLSSERQALQDALAKKRHYELLWQAIVEGTETPGR